MDILSWVIQIENLDLGGFIKLPDDATNISMERRANVRKNFRKINKTMNLRWIQHRNAEATVHAITNSPLEYADWFSWRLERFERSNFEPPIPQYFFNSACPLLNKMKNFNENSCSILWTGICNLARFLCQLDSIKFWMKFNFGENALPYNCACDNSDEWTPCFNLHFKIFLNRKYLKMG